MHISDFIWQHRPGDNRNCNGRSRYSVALCCTVWFNDGKRDRRTHIAADHLHHLVQVHSGRTLIVDLHNDIPFLKPCLLRGSSLQRIGDHRHIISINRDLRANPAKTAIHVLHKLFCLCGIHKFSERIAQRINQAINSAIYHLLLIQISFIDVL